MINYILKIDPSASLREAEQLAKIWERVVGSIVEEMLTISTPVMEELHIDLREEMALEMAKLIQYLSESVVNKRMENRTINDIDLQSEYDECFSLKGKERISNTAKNCADGIWLPKYHDRWKPKTKAALRKEEKPKVTVITPQNVEDNHFIPKSFIKRYWSKGQYVFRCTKNPEGFDEKKKIPLGSWGFRKNLYSNRLEAYFGLIEGDAAKPIQMMLKVEPLNRPQREALIGFIIIQRIRNPYFIDKIERSVAPVVASEVGQNKAADKEYMRAVYETLYKQNHFYEKLAKPMWFSEWVVLRSETPDFVLPDVCNIFGNHEGCQFVIMPFTPKDCLIVLPLKVKEQRSIPHYIKASDSISKDVSYILRCAAKNEYLSDSDAAFHGVNEEPNEVIQRIITTLSQIVSKKYC
ncbi:DUF4238 domain-containing protein [Vibrio vulnificus]